MEPVGYDQVAVEFKLETGWHLVGTVAEGHPPASMRSEDESHPRQVYMFGWVGGQGPGVWASLAGIDIESGSARFISALDGFQLLGDLREEDCVEVQLHRTGQPPTPLRWRLIPAGSKETPTAES